MKWLDVADVLRRCAALVALLREVVEELATLGKDHPDLGAKVERLRLSLPHLEQVERLALLAASSSDPRDGNSDSVRL